MVWRGETRLDSRATCVAHNRRMNATSRPLQKPYRPTRGWMCYAALLLGELALLAWITRAGVAKGWWSDLAGGLIFLLCPLLIRFAIVAIAYRLSRSKGLPLNASQRLRGVAWWKFFLTEYWHFCKQSFLHLPFPHFFRTAADRGSSFANGPVIVLQHGYVHNGAVWSPLSRLLEARGYRVFTIDQPLYQPIDDMADRLSSRIESVCASAGVDSVVLMAHSMGGLISRAYLRKYGASRIERLITLGSPHHGTYHAHLAFGANGAQMLPGNAWLAELGRTRVNVPFTSIYSIYDTLIAPQNSSHMAEATNVVLTGVGHVAMFASPQIHRAVFDAMGVASAVDISHAASNSA
jgi:triacylglycerol lipase